MWSRGEERDGSILSAHYYHYYYIAYFEMSAAIQPQPEKPQPEKSMMIDIDIEKNDASTSDVVVSESTASNALYKGRSWWSKLVSWGVEVRGITPVPVEERTDTRLVNIFTVWFTMSVSVLPYV
jgi:hypothetical protein